MIRTLDDVIKIYEHGISKVEAYDAVEDALHYLKIYRGSLTHLQEMMDRYEINDRNYQEAIQNCEMVQLKYQQLLDDYNDNPPLTWDKLKQMEGKPVWIEGGVNSYWRVIELFSDNPYYESERILFTDDCMLFKKDMGTNWQAYRKEKTEQ